MIQDIAPHVYDNAFAHRRAPRLGDAVLISRSGKEVLIRETEEGFRFPTVSEVGEMPLNFGFLIDDTAYFFGESGQEPEGFRYAKLAEFREKEPRYLSFAAVTGLQLIRWMETQHVCGACGTKLEPRGDNLVVRATVPEITDYLMDLKDNSGYFFEYDCDDILELKPLCDDKRCQTIGLLGDARLLEPLLRSGIRGVDRVAPLGKTMDFDMIWDGYDLVGQLTRTIKL